ncbi:MAG: SH3 domain-containing protein [Tenuifilaceae bacterium]
MFQKGVGLILFVFLLFLFASCSKPSQYYAKERYIVSSNSLNIRLDPTSLSRTIGILSKGDTITALASDKYWIMVKVGGQTGFVSSDYVKKLGPIATPRFFSIIERNSDWKTWQFWVISIILIALWIASELGLIRYENYLKRTYGVGAKSISITPLIFFVTGIMAGILYLYWRDQVIESLFYNFSILPKGMGSIAWIIWVQCLIIVLGMIVDYIGSLYRTGLKYGQLTFLIELGTNLIIFSTTFFLTISLFIAAIIFLVIFFAILYTIVVTESSKSITGFLSGR